MEQKKEESLVEELKREVERLRNKIRGMEHIHEYQINQLIMQLNEKSSKEE